MKDTLVIICTVIAALCLLVGVTSLFGGYVLILYKFATIGQVFGTIVVCIVLGCGSAFIASCLD